MGEERILIVEDERALAEALAYNLGREGYVAEAVGTGREALERLREAEPPFDLVLLDLQLPDISGTQVCRALRGDASIQHTPVIMVTARVDEGDRVIGFESGADDYVTKPYSVRELALRVRAVLRRSGTEAPGDALEAGPFLIEPRSHEASWRGEALQLTPIEFKLLHTFVSRAGEVQTRERLLHDVWGMHADARTRTIDTHVKRLREKLGPAGAHIATVRGVGYRFDPELREE